MTFLPIVGRELRVASRQRVTWRTRFLAVLSALVVFGWIWGTMGRYATPPQISKSLFYGMSWLAFLYVLFAGTFTTADCVSEEKREGTLGLLFLTDLRGMDVVFGKMAATSLHAFYGLLAIFPIMTIPVLMGGLLWEDIAKSLLVLVNTLFVSLSIGMVVSAYGHEEKRVTGSTLGSVLMLAAGMPLVVALLASYADDHPRSFLFGLKPLFEWLLILSPGTGLSLSLFGKMGITIPDAYWWSLGFNHALGWLCLLSAARHMQNAWKDKPATVRQLSWRQRWRQWCYGTGQERARYRSRFLSINPFLWLGSRDRLTPWLVWLFLGIVGAIWLWAWFENGKEIGEVGVGIAFCYPTHFLLKLWMIAEATACLGRERQSGALELILATPARIEDILQGQWRALNRKFLRPTLFVLAVEFLYMIANWSERDSTPLFVTYMLTSALDYWAIGWVGLWMGLNARKQHIAARGTMARVLALPWGLWFGMLLLGMLGRTGGGEGWLILWGLLSAGCAFFFGAAAWTSLTNEFRTVATQAVGGRRG